MGARQSAPQTGVGQGQVAGLALPWASSLEGLENAHVVPMFGVTCDIPLVVGFLTDPLPGPARL